MKTDSITPVIIQSFQIVQQAIAQTLVKEKEDAQIIETSSSLGFSKVVSRLFICYCAVMIFKTLMHKLSSSINVGVQAKPENISVQ